MSKKPAAVLIALLAVGCSSGHAKVGAHATPTQASPSPVTSTATAADAVLARQLVRASDLPAGYIEGRADQGNVAGRQCQRLGLRAQFCRREPVVDDGASGADSACAGVVLEEGLAQLHPGRSIPLSRRSVGGAGRGGSARRLHAAAAHSPPPTPPASKSSPSALSPLRFPQLGDSGVATDGTLTSKGDTSTSTSCSCAPQQRSRMSPASPTANGTSRR